MIYCIAGTYINAARKPPQYIICTFFSSFIAFIQNRGLKRQEDINFVPTFTAIMVPLIYNTDSSTEKAMCFPINTFSD